MTVVGVAARRRRPRATAAALPHIRVESSLSTAAKNYAAAHRGATSFDGRSTRRGLRGVRVRGSMCSSAEGDVLRRRVLRANLPSRCDASSYGKQPQWQRKAFTKMLCSADHAAARRAMARLGSRATAPAAGGERALRLTTLLPRPSRFAARVIIGPPARAAHSKWF